MISAEKLLSIFKEFGFSYFTGVPDSTFKNFLSLLYNRKSEITHRPAVNECEATFMAGGYHVSTGKIGVVYMQNSGLGKTVNPITSYLRVYQIPALLLIGWRGQEEDEPQHEIMGKIMKDLLLLLEIPYQILPDEENAIKQVLSSANAFMINNKRPYAIIIPQKNSITGKNGFEDKIKNYLKKKPEINREDVVEEIVKIMDKDDIIITNTGKTSRELFEIREKNKQEHNQDFLNVGGMGGASAQALEIALQQPNRKVYLIDGDGAALMQLGTMASIGKYRPKNLIHIIIDNSCYQSTGNQPTISDSCHFAGLGYMFGYKKTKAIYLKKQLSSTLEEFKKYNDLSLLIVYCSYHCRSNLGRPTRSPLDNKIDFMKQLGLGGIVRYEIKKNGVLLSDGKQSE